MRDEWLSSVLTRGTGSSGDVPWRPQRHADVAAIEREVHDGLLRRVVADVVIAADVSLDAALRARSLALLVPAGVVVLAEAAAWVHLGGPVAAPHEVQVAGARLPEHRQLPLRLVFSRVRPGPEDVLELAGLHLTTPARTLLDVASAQPHRAPWLRERRVDAGLVADEDVREASDRARGRGGVRTARRALDLPRAPRARAEVRPSSDARP